MASLSKRLSLSSSRSRKAGRSRSPLAQLVVAPNTESEEWVRDWEDTMARGASLSVLCCASTCSVLTDSALWMMVLYRADLIEHPVVEVEATMTVEDACDVSGTCFEMSLRASGLTSRGRYSCCCRRVYHALR